MTKKLLKKSLLLFLSGIIIVSCTLENEALHEHNHKNGLKIETMSYAELMKNNQFSRAVKRIPKKQVITQDFTGRSVVEDTYGFTILDAPVKVIEVDNKTSYTLQVVTDENTTGELENLILFENPIDDKIGHIITYNTLATTSETENEIVEAGIKEATTITTTDTNKGVISMHLTYYCKAYGTSGDCGGTNAATGCYQYWEMTVSSGGGDGAAGFGEPADAGNAEIGVVEGSGGNANPPSEEEDNSVVISPTHCPGGCPEAENIILENFLNNLSSVQLEYWNDLSPREQQNIVDYLEENSSSDESLAFVKEALATLNEGGEVDFTLQIILDPSFKNNPCLKGVYDTMIQNSPTANNYLNNFDSTMSVANLMFVSSNSLSSDTNAETSPPQNYLISITFNSNNLNRPQLSIARTFIHELIHAEIFRKLLSISNHPSINLTNNDLNLIKENFPGIFDYYVRYKFNVPSGQVLTDPQHQMMAQHYRDIISDAIKEFDNNQHSQDVYDALAWVGLMGEGSINMTTGLTSNPTVAWQNLTPTQRINIINTVTTFESSNTNCQ